MASVSGYGGCLYRLFFYICGICGDDMSFITVYNSFGGDDDLKYW
ncbi:MAG: hypothetical protein ABIK22_01695 [candidate division WOR-3 bacterium]